MNRRDDLNPARGLITGAAIGLVLWGLIFAAGSALASAWGVAP